MVIKLRIAVVPMVVNWLVNWHERHYWSKKIFLYLVWGMGYKDVWIHPDLLKYSFKVYFKTHTLCFYYETN